MKAIIEKYGFDGVWHFTDRENLESIQKHGLLSLAETQQRNIKIPKPGGNDWSYGADKIKGLDKYIHLAFVDNHPMLYVAKEKEKRLLNPVWLKIDSSVLLGEGVRFTPGVSNKKDVPILTADEAKEKIDWDALLNDDWKRKDWDRWLDAHKSEILVPDFISGKKILGYKNG